jgi:rhodanese-related sulfurtransferase
MLLNSANYLFRSLAPRHLLPLQTFAFAQHAAHSSDFLKVVEDARTRIKELTVDQARHHLEKNHKAVLVDVREDSEWGEGHAVNATHLGKGVLERDIGTKFPDHNQEMIMYCGGGFRSAITCDVAQKMGYKHVYSLIGGYKALIHAGWPMNTDVSHAPGDHSHHGQKNHGHNKK